ncbi:MAG: hypothetical protein ACJA02_000243 [Myxococcota bacterium]|jgi:hypothetical protein
MINGLKNSAIVASSTSVVRAAALLKNASQ